MQCFFIEKFEDNFCFSLFTFPQVCFFAFVLASINECFYLSIIYRYVRT